MDVISSRWSNMYVKYYGLVPHDTLGYAPRLKFLENGLFRFTQPTLLNDKNETKFLPFFNQFSPADYAWARKESKKTHSLLFKGDFSDEELAKFFLMPSGRRYGDVMPYLVKREYGLDSMEEYDKLSFNNFTNDMNNNVPGLLSCVIGVLSLSRNPLNELMWTHYASDGKGIAVTFNENHTFFSSNQTLDVSYKDEDRATLTYYKGKFRINGHQVKDFHVSDLNNPALGASHLIRNGVDIFDLSNRLIFSKSAKWSYEEEVRVISLLSDCNAFDGDIYKPNFDESLANFFDGGLLKYTPEICLKKIPFDAIESIIIGYQASDEIKRYIYNKVIGNSETKHIRVLEAYHDVFQKLDTKEYNPV